MVNNYDHTMNVANVSAVNFELIPLILLLDNSLERMMVDILAEGVALQILVEVVVVLVA